MELVGNEDTDGIEPFILSPLLPCDNGTCNITDPDEQFGVNAPETAELESLENIVKIVVPVSFRFCLFLKFCCMRMV